MAWNDLEEPLAGRREQLLARVVGRGERLRQRRRVVSCAAALSAVLAVAVPAAVWSGTDGPRTRAVTASGGDTSPESSVSTAATMDGTTTVPTPSDSIVSATPPPSAGPPPTPSPSRPATQPPSPATPPASESPTPTVHAGDAPQLPRCTAADLEVTATPDKSSYGPGEVVKVTGALRNQSSQTCIYGASLTFEVRDGAGTLVFGFHSHADYLAGHEPTIGPGQSVRTLAAEWPQQRCAGMDGCSPAPPGTYTIVYDVGYGSVTIPVTITPE